MADSISDDGNNETVESDPECFDETEGEALLLSVFEACNIDENGKVKVSKLISHLLAEAAADENPKILGYLDELAIVLDPSGNDISIDKAMYNQGIRSWIRRVQAQRSFQDFDETDGKLLDDRSDDPAFVYKGRGEDDLNIPAFVNGYGERSFEDPSFCTSESTNEWEKSQSEILGRIQELQIANKKLMEEKEKLRSQVDNTEEANSLLHNEIRGMRNKISRYEQLLEKTKSIEKEHESLKNTVNDYHTAREELLARTGHLEKENSALQLMVEDYQKSDLSKNTALEKIHEENRDLLEKLNQQKQLYSDLEILQDLKQKMVDESSSKSEYLASFIAELSMANEALKAEKNRLEVDLLESKHEISKLNAMQTPSSASSRQPIYASTPFQRNAPCNLQQELEAEAVSEDLSTSSRDESGRHSSVTNERAKNETNKSGNSDISVSTTASNDKYSSVAQQIALNFKRKKDLVLKQIVELAAFDKNSDTAQQSQVLIKNYEEGLDKFANEVEGLEAAKQLAEIRSARLMESLELAKAENKRLAESQERALLKLGDISLTSEEMEQRINELVKEVNEEKDRVGKLISENDKLKEQLKMEETRNSELTLEIEDLKRSTTSMKEKLEDKVMNRDDQQMEDLINLVTNLEERSREYTRKLFDLEDNLNIKDVKITEKDEEIKRLKTECLEITKRHDNDLREIMKMFSIHGDSLSQTQIHESPSIEGLRKRFEILMVSVKSTLHNMGVRDGPIGSEGNGTMKEYLPERSSQTKLPDRPLDIGVNLKNDWEVKSTATKCCQTDIGLLELEEAMYAYTMLKALQEKDDDEDPMEDGHGVIRSLDEKTDSNYFDMSRDEYERSGWEGNTENVECDGAETDYNLHDNSVLSNSNSKAVSGLMECQNTVDQYDNRDFEDVDRFNHLISGKPEESTDQSRSSRKTVDGAQEPATQDMHYKLNEDFPNEEKVIKKKRLMTRSDSVSTDESNFSDEIGNVLIEDLLNRPDISAKSEQSPAISELSDLSTASRRGRRIGISAEPVRLPTWTELRESIKLNQQIFLEEEMTNEQISGTPGNSIDDVKVDCKTHDINCNKPDGKENIDSQRVSDGSHLADTSMERCYELPKDQTGTDHVMPQHLNVGIAKQDSKDSVASSVHSLAESVQTLHSRESSKVTSNTVNSGKGSAEEEKVSLSTSENRDKLSEVGRKNLVQKNEEHPGISIAHVDRDLEKRFNTIVLSFKTDQYTLQRRLENQERARDVAESGMEREIRKLTEKLQSAEKLSFTRELKESLGNLLSHTDVLRKAGMKVSAQAEQHGCFQQESKLAPAIETVITYAECLRLALERGKETDEIRETNSTDLTSSSRKGVDKKSDQYDYCKKCRGILNGDDENIVKENGHLGEGKRKEKKSNSLTFFGLASSILRERKASQMKLNDDGEEESSFCAKEAFTVKQPILNYSKNDVTEGGDVEESSVAQFQSPLCNCLTMIFRFFVSVVMLSTVLFLFANYVELDLTRMLKNSNEHLLMYFKKFFSKSKESI